MASISSLTSSTGSTNSLYGNRNVLSGLASGMDTEAMIENSISGYKKKVASLQQDQTQLTWKQDAYRGIIDKLVSVKNTYGSFTSSTNLASHSFFTKSITTSAEGTYASKISATGQSSSEISISKVTSLATAASYSVSAGALGYTSSDISGSAINWGETVEQSTMTGTMTIGYGSKSYNLSFSATDVYKSAEELAQGIQDKLNKVEITNKFGETEKLGDKITVTAGADGTITFSDTDGNNVYIKSASSNIKDTLGITTGTEEGKSFQVTDPDSMFTTKTMAEYLSNQSVSVTLNGVTKTIKTGDLTGADNPGQALRDNLQSALDSAFGAGRVSVALNENGGLSFGGEESQRIQVTSSVGEKLGIGDAGVSNYLNTNRKIGDFFEFENGEEDLVINGVKVGTYGADTTLSKIISDINNSGAGVKVSYSSLTNEFRFTASETGSTGRIDFGEGSSLASQLFGSIEGSFVSGTDAELTATVNGREMTIRRASNTVDLDGMSVTLKGTFEAASTEDAVKFSSKADSDTIVNAVKSFVQDYNSILKEVHTAYSTQPLKDSSGGAYKPLTDTDRADMSESAISSYEEKAKTGILFADSDLSALYGSLRDALQTGDALKKLEAIGITQSYYNGTIQLSLDESKLRSALDSDPSKVENAFATTQNGDSGIMKNVASAIDKYANTTSGSPGILVQLAGSKYSPVSLLNNTLQTKIDKLDDTIASWQDKMSSKIDYYTKQFTALEKLINSMNSQSSMLSGLMGG